MKLSGKNGSPGYRPNLPARQIYTAILLVVGVMALMTGSILVLRFKPVGQSGNPAVVEKARAPVPDKLDPMRTTVQNRLDSFKKKQKDGRIDLEDLKLLEETIGLQQEVIRVQGGASSAQLDMEKLEVLMETYDKEMGSFLKAQSIRLEEEAIEFHDAGDLARALEALESARNLQDRINNELRRSTDRDPSRQHQLANRILDWQTKPIADRADRLLEEALDLRASHQYRAAIEKMEAALQNQQRLNQEFRSSPYALHSRLKSFEETWNTVQAAEDVDKMEKLMEEAQSLLASGEENQALRKARDARQLYDRLDDTFGALSEIPDSTTRELAILSDTAASVSAFMELDRQAATCRALLQSKNLESFANAVSEWLRSSQDFLEKYPDSTYADQVNLEEVTFLHDRRDFLPNILDTVYANLLPLGDKTCRMYRTEVPQFLYKLVTGRNPSHNRGNLLPVDSVTWEEARRFVQMMNWILAKPVTLPTEADYRRILSDEPRETEQVWSNRSSGRQTQDVGTSKPDAAGFYDMLGNVAEWLATPEAGSIMQAPLFGGSAREDFETLRSLPTEWHGIQERLRFSGFRFIVHEVE